ncbi:MAG: DUF1028 domain-containing protein [Gemmatimonadota bacterium]|nr:DUF1028 domain-containing protein [Gemmatimonadota bacterium]
MSEWVRHRAEGWLSRSLIVAAAAAIFLAVLPIPASATWSVIAVDRSTGQVVIASATCVPQARLLTFPADDLRDIQAVVVPGMGVAAAQAGVDRDRSNQELIFRQLEDGTHPSRILEMLMTDPEIQDRQFGIVDLEGRFAGFSGAQTSAASSDVQGRVPGTEIYYSIQGNILASYSVVQDAVGAMEESEGSVTDRVIAAMEAADRAGGDARCSCEDESAPDAPCEYRHADVAYIMAADADDEAREEEGFNDGDYPLYISVTDENTRSDENANPVVTLRMRYDAWRAEPDP